MKRLALTLLLLGATIAGAQTLLTPNASAPAQRLYTALNALSGKHCLSGQFMGWYPACSLDAANQIHQQTSNWVAIAGFDYYETFLNVPPTKPDTFKPPRWRYINELIRAHHHVGGISTLSLHMTNPWNGKLAWDKTGRLQDLLDPTTPAYANYKQQLDQVADGLADLQQDNIPILFRPLHEMTNPFWWGGQNPDTLKQLWTNLVHYYTHDKKLTNLIWIWSPEAHYPNLLRYYPGDNYVDIIGLDIYRNHLSTVKAAYDEITATGKPFAITEFGPEGDSFASQGTRNYDYGALPAQIQANMPRTIFILAWRDAWSIYRNKNAAQFMTHPYIHNRDDFTY